MGSINSLKVLFPRLLVPLKNELIKEVCCGYSHTMVVNQYGQLFSWGNNENGQLGLGPKSVPNVIRKPVLNPYIHNVAKLSAGNEHSIALTKSNELYVWGSLNCTGMNDTENRTVPTKHEFFKNLKINSVACGGLHTMVLTKTGEIYTWGSTEGGQLGLGEMQHEVVKTPYQVKGISDK